MRKLLLSVLILLVAISVCRADPVRIGLSLGLTGKYAPMAGMQERAFRLWENHVNKGGGILGRNVHLAIYDDQSDVAKARQLYRHMIEKEKVDLLFPPYSSGLTSAIMPIAEKYGYPILISGASADSIWKQGNRYVFGVYIPASRYTQGFIEMIALQGYSRVAIVFSEDPFSIDVAAGAERWARWLGMDIVLHKKINKDTQDLDLVAQSAKDVGAQAVVMCGHLNESVHMRQAMKQINWYPKAYYASVGPAVKAYYELVGEQAENTFTSTQWKYYDRLPFPGGKAFFDSFSEAYHIEPSYHAATAYASAMILSSAIKMCGSLEKEKIRAILADLDCMTLLGRYGVDRTGMQIRHFPLILQWINGSQEVVWPIELRTAKARFTRDIP